MDLCKGCPSLRDSLSPYATVFWLPRTLIFWGNLDYVPWLLSNRRLERGCICYCELRCCHACQRNPLLLHIAGQHGISPDGGSTMKFDPPENQRPKGAEG